MKNPSPFGQGVGTGSRRARVGYPVVSARAAIWLFTFIGPPVDEVVELRGFEPLTF